MTGKYVEQSWSVVWQGKDYDMILIGPIVRMQAPPLRGIGLFYPSAYSSKLETLRNKKARLLRSGLVSIC